MRTSLRIVIVVASLTAGRPGAAAQPDAGARRVLPVNLCVVCHGTPELFQGEKRRFFFSKEDFAEDVHIRNGVWCHDCHGGDPLGFSVAEAHTTKVDKEKPWASPFRLPLSTLQNSCATCHKEQTLGVAGGVHAEAGEQNDEGGPTPLACARCHGGSVHNLRPAGDPRSSVSHSNQVTLCGGCHKRALDTYTESVHGHGLFESRLLVTAVCADCHGAHGIYRAKDKRSTLCAANVAATCAQCHRFIKERLEKSVHGRGNGPGGVSEKAAPGGKIKRKPSCTDCHKGHDLPHPRTKRFRLQLADRCGSCHNDLLQEYGMSLHGALSDLGYLPAARCADCHGAHDILPISDPQSPLAAGANRLGTCRTCHPNAVVNFCNFQPHANYLDFERYPILHSVYLAMEILIYSVFAFFGIHALLWFARSLRHVARHGRPERLSAGGAAYVRFEPIHRLLHATVIVSFLLLALTGLPLRYSGQPWAQTLARGLGGFDSTGLWHHICGIVTFCYFGIHLLWLTRRIFQQWRHGTRWMVLVFGPDSPVPNLRDFVDMYRMFRWFLGRGPKPVFERWTYWEKFDYWAVFWGVAIIGVSGLMLWFPNLFCRFLPGEALNVAKVVHSEEALLATSFVFAIHFFGTHLRPEKFPIDMAILTGLVTEADMREERPEYFERLRREGKLDELEATVPSRRVLTVTTLGGFLALVVGLGLLVGILLAVFGS